MGLSPSPCPDPRMCSQNGESPGLHPPRFSPPAAQQTQVQTSSPEQPPGSQAAVPGKAARPQQPAGVQQGLDARKPCPELQPLVAGGFWGSELQQDSATLRAQPCLCLVPASGLGERLLPQGRAVCVHGWEERRLAAPQCHLQLGLAALGEHRSPPPPSALLLGAPPAGAATVLGAFLVPGRALGRSTGNIKPMLWTPEQTSW